jgi:hypothetical protein
MYVFINENPIHSFILLPKFRGEICAREIYQAKTLEWVDFFEEPNLKGITVGHIQICRGEISGM